MSDDALDEESATPAVPLLPHPEPVRRRRRWGALAAAATAGLVVGSAAVALAWDLSGSGESGVFTLVGQVKIAPGDSSIGSCTGDGIFNDVDAGALVTVYDSAGRVVATGTLGGGAQTSAYMGCVFPVAVWGVPDDSKSYSVQVAWHEKARVTNAQARAGELVISLGG